MEVKEAEEFVDGNDGWISDESSFYGDEERRKQLENQVSEFDPARYWCENQSSLSSIAAANVAAAAKAKATGKLRSANLYNPYEGLAYARQLKESIEEFLQRLPPLTTSATENGPWIRIANPHSPKRPLQEDLAGLTASGSKILADFSARKAEIETEMSGRPKSTMARKVTEERKIVEEALLAAAVENNCTSGKWMLFPMPEDLGHTWRLVATATARNELGMAAKVSADEGKGNRVPRLICVYTRDFSNMEDVKKVLWKLVEMDLVQRPARDPKGVRSIYYKCNAYTHLGISSGNEWGLKASMYASRDLLLSKK